MVHVPMSVSYGDEMQPGFSAGMGSLCLPQSVLSGHWGLKAISQQPVPAGVLGCFRLSQLVLLSPLASCSCCPDSPSTELHPTLLPGHAGMIWQDAVFLGRKERAVSAMKVERALGFQGGFWQCWDFMTTNHKDSVGFVT